MNKSPLKTLYGINFNNMHRHVAATPSGKDWHKVCAHGISTDEDCEGCRNMDFVIQKQPAVYITSQDE